MHHYLYTPDGLLQQERVGEDVRLYEYDKRGHLIAAYQKAEGKEFLVQRSYDLAGNLLEESTYLDGVCLFSSRQEKKPSQRTLFIAGERRDFFYEGGRLKQILIDGKELKQMPEFKNKNWEGILEVY